jgi:hypothetical protein
MIQNTTTAYLQSVAYAPSNPEPPTQPNAPPPVLPEPAGSVDTAGGDPMSMIYELISKQRNNDLISGKANVTHNEQTEKADQLEQQAAVKKEEQAEQSAAAWGIFGKIASVIAIAVSAVAAVCSCGAASGLCAAACVLSTLAFVEGQAHVLTSLTGNPDVDKAFQIGCGVGAALCSGGAGIATLGSSVLVGTSELLSSGCGVAQQTLGAVNDKGCQTAATAFGIGGAVTGVVGAAGSVAGVAQTTGGVVDGVVKATSEVVKGVTEVGAGVATIVSSQFQGDATDRATDAKQAQQGIDQLQTLTSWLVDGMQETDKSHGRALSTLSNAIQTQAQTLVIAAAKV